MADATPDTDRPAGDSASGVRPSGWTRWAGALIPAGTIGSLVLFDLPACPVKLLAGVPCPGCGLTRATEAAMFGDFEASLHFHPLALIITPVVLWWALWTTLQILGWTPKGRRDWMSRLPDAVWLSFGAAVVGVWIARMLGALGGHPDPIDPASGLIARGFAAIFGS